MASQILKMLIIILALFEWIITACVFISKNKKKTIIMNAYFLASIVALCQVIVRFNRNYTVNIVTQSLSHLLTAVVLGICIRYAIYITNQEDCKYLEVLEKVYLVALIPEFILMIINPFTELAFSYSYNEDSVVGWVSNHMSLYYYHTSICHLAALFILIILIRKCYNAPLMYCRAYFNIIATIIVLFILECVADALYPANDIDFLLFIYAIFSVCLYWNVFMYADGAMLDHVRFMSLNEYRNPMLLFDYQDRLILKNNESKKLLEALNSNKSDEELTAYISEGVFTVSQLVRDCKFEMKEETLQEDNFFNWSFNRDGIISSYRIDYTILKDDNGKDIGKLFIFTDMSEEMDSLTGFHKNEYFKRYFGGKYDSMQYPVGILLIDVVKLEQINETFGREKGDRVLQYIALLMMKYCPEGSYFVRDNDAVMMAVCPETDESSLYEILRRINEGVNEKNSAELNVTLWYTYGVAENDGIAIIQLASSLSENLRTKKMVYGDTTQTSLMDSLIQVQKEMDPYLDGHIKRTRKLCELLGKKLGLNEENMNNLAMLCMIHDIGNIGVPIEIVNKPGRLTVDEWELMKSHVDKGYRIAIASKEFRSIAVCILHHHENYSGNGYPDRLAGESIPLLSRIISVIEAYDAMTNERPYRPPMSPLLARKELQRNAGDLYDPHIVEVFVELLNEIAPVDPAEEEKILKNTITAKPMSINSDEVDNIKVQSVEHSTYILNEHNVIIEIDANFEKITGYSKEDVETNLMTQKDLIFPVDWAYYSEKVELAIGKSGTAYFEHRIRCKDGSEKYVFCYGRRYYDNVAKAGRSTIIITDIGDKRKVIAADAVQVQNNSIISNNKTRNVKSHEGDSYSSDKDVDDLTGLMTGRIYDNLNQRLFANDEENLLIVLVDIDSFAEFSLNNGSKAEASMLRFVSGCLEQIVGKQGIVARTGKDLFSCTLSLQKEDDEYTVKARVAEVWGLLMDSLEADGSELTVSIGASFAKVGNRDYRESYQKAITMLTGVKKNGKKAYKIS